MGRAPLPVVNATAPENGCQCAQECPGQGLSPTNAPGSRLRAGYIEFAALPCVAGRPCPAARPWVRSIVRGFLVRGRYSGADPASGAGPTAASFFGENPRSNSDLRAPCTKAAHPADHLQPVARRRARRRARRAVFRFNGSARRHASTPRRSVFSINAAISRKRSILFACHTARP